MGLPAGKDDHQEATNEDIERHGARQESALCANSVAAFGARADPVRHVSNDPHKTHFCGDPEARRPVGIVGERHSSQASASASPAESEALERRDDTRQPGRHVRFLAPLAYLARARLIRPPLLSEPSSETTSANAPASASRGPVIARMRTGLKESEPVSPTPRLEIPEIGKSPLETGRTKPPRQTRFRRSPISAPAKARGIRGSAPHAAKSADLRNAWLTTQSRETGLR